jgi:flagellar M-ring protein FliF
VSRMDATLGRAKGLMAGFTPGQRGVIAVAAIALVLGAVGLSRWAAQPTWTPLFSNLSGGDANAIVEQLRTDNITYQLADGGATVLVPQSQVYDVRVSLAGKGLPSSDSDGYSILDSQGMTATDFQQNIAYRRALEGELGKTLQAITGVQTAIVHLAMPKKDVFATEQDRATASVLMAVTPGTELTDGQVRSITHLVAGSVEGLDPSDVNVSDSKGNLLSTREDGADGAASRASSADEQTAKFEDRMSTSVQQMLDRVLGPGKAVVRVNAQLDYDTKDTTTESYVRESPAPQPLSETTLKEGYANGAAGAAGSLGVTWPTLTPGAGSETGSSYLKESRTVDNAIGKVVERAQAAPGAVERLTVAVVLDDKAAGAVDPARVQALVANAVGLDPQRGDTVQVDKLAFDTTSTQAAAKELEAAQKAERTAGYLDLGKKAGIGLLVLVALFLMTRRRKGGATVEAAASDLPDPGLTAGRQMLGGAPVAITSELEVDPVIERDRMRDEVAALVDNQPDEVAAMIQGWLSERKS